MFNQGPVPFLDGQMWHVPVCPTYNERLYQCIGMLTMTRKSALNMHERTSDRVILQASSNCSRLTPNRPEMIGGYRNLVTSAARSVPRVRPPTRLCRTRWSSRFGKKKNKTRTSTSGMTEPTMSPGNESRRSTFDRPYPTG